LFKPHSLHTSHIIFGRHPPGHKDAGKRYVDLAHGLATDKTHKLSLGQTSVCEFKAGMFKITENTEDPYDYVKVLHYFCLVYLGPVYNGPFFLRRAGKKEIARRQAQNDKSEANFEPSGHFGKNYHSQILKDLARFCGFLHPEKVTGRSFRRWAITNLAKKGVSAGVLLEHSRHRDRDICTNALYQESTKDQVKHLQHAKQYQNELRRRDDDNNIIPQVELEPSRAKPKCLEDFSEDKKPSPVRPCKRPHTQRRVCFAPAQIAPSVGDVNMYYPPPQAYGYHPYAYGQPVPPPMYFPYQYPQAPMAPQYGSMPPPPPRAPVQMAYAQQPQPQEYDLEDFDKDIL
jgi:hypothetical protein